MVGAGLAVVVEEMLDEEEMSVAAVEMSR